MIRALPAPLAIPWLRLTATTLVIIVALFHVGVILTYEPSLDIRSFLRAAELMAAGERFYGAYPAPLSGYVYAPWFAAALIPATWAPGLFIPLWHAFLAVCLSVALLPLLRTRTLEGTLAAVIIGALGFHGVWIGHVEPAMVVMLVLALPTRWGPAAIGVAASLKLAPIMLAVVYAGRGEWGKVAVSVGVAAVLWAPAFLFDLSHYLDTGHNLGLVPMLVGIGVGGIVTFTLARTRYAWLAGAVAWFASMPLLRLYDAAGLLVATRGLEWRHDGRHGSIRRADATNDGRRGNDRRRVRSAMGSGRCQGAGLPCRAWPHPTGLHM